jgi:ribosome-associated translation inhibitor RaiA
MQKTETMNLQVQLRGMRSRSGLDLLIEESLNALRRLIPISAARVVLEQQRGSAPPFRVFAHLAVPGPDIHAEARDCTLQAAWRKLVGNLKKQFQRRTTRQHLRLKGRGQCRTVASQWNRGA